MGEWYSEAEGRGQSVLKSLHQAVGGRTGAVREEEAGGTEDAALRQRKEAQT